MKDCMFFLSLISFLLMKKSIICFYVSILLMSCGNEKKESEKMLAPTTMNEENEEDEEKRKAEQANTESTESLLEKFANAEPINREKLIGVWIATDTRFVLKNPEPESENTEDMFDIWIDNGYIFKENGVYEVKTIIDNDGKWSLINDNTRLKLENNLRKDVEEHQVMWDEDGNMYWMTQTDDAYMFLFLAPAELADE